MQLSVAIEEVAYTRLLRAQAMGRTARLRRRPAVPRRDHSGALRSTVVIMPSIITADARTGAAPGSWVRPRALRLHARRSPPAEATAPRGRLAHPGHPVKGTGRERDVRRKLHHDHA